MIEEITIRGLAAIDEAVLEPSSGFTVLTGETGAGKTMVLAGLGLLLGERSDSALVRPGRERAEVDGRVRVPAGGPLRDALTEAGVELEEESTVLLGRTVGVDGRSRAFLAGRPVPAGVLAELAEHVVAVHGQSAQQRLLRPAEQRAALDRYAGEPVARAKERYQLTYRRWQAAGRELAELTEQELARAREADLLRAGLRRVESVDPQPGEDVTLRAAVARLDHAEALRSAADLAHVLLTGSSTADGAGGGGDGPDLRAALAEASRALTAVGEHDASLAELATRLGELGFQLADAASQLSSYATSVESDPASLAAGHERLAQLASLAREHGGQLDAALDWAAAAGTRLLELDTDAGRREQLAEQVLALRAELTEHAGALRAARAAAADRFGRAVSAELGALAMPSAQVTAILGEREDPGGLSVDGRVVAFGLEGVDEVELTLSAHPGAPPRPLQRGASGGELSRVMLAVEVVFAGTDPVPCMVFDEVDAGVGGAAAVEVGRRLARLSRDHQVICVTHLAQVAAFADRHLHVSKQTDGTVTRSGITVLTGPERVRELARMLGGLADSELGQGHAEELLALAAAGC